MSFRRRDRWRDVSIAPLKGEFRILEPVLVELERWLPTYRGADGHHEGIAFLAGFERRGVSIFTTAIFPEADHRSGYVRCNEKQFAAASATAGSHGLGLLAGFRQDILDSKTATTS